MYAIRDYQGKKYDSSIVIGNDVYIGRYVFLVAAQGITISSGCVLSEHVYITDENHGYNPLAGPIMQQELESKGPVRIGPNCLLGYRTAVMPGVTLGEWCIVGANSVVTHSFPSYSMIAGAPARLIKVYSHELRQWVEPGTVE
jgi:acetyltransferase-like isoleucine patch superfamily enzyme